MKIPKKRQRDRTPPPPETVEGPGQGDADDLSGLQAMHGGMREYISSNTYHPQVHSSAEEPPRHRPRREEEEGRAGGWGTTLWEGGEGGGQEEEFLPTLPHGLYAPFGRPAAPLAQQPFVNSEEEEEGGGDDDDEDDGGDDDDESDFYDPRTVQGRAPRQGAME